MRRCFAPLAVGSVLSCTWYSPWPCASHPAVQHLGTASKSLSKAKEPQDPVEARRQHGLELEMRVCFYRDESRGLVRHGIALKNQGQAAQDLNPSPYYIFFLSIMIIIYWLRFRSSTPAGPTRRHGRAAG